MTIKECEVGKNVTYKGVEKGVIKSLNEFNDTVVFVVYHCNGEWNNFLNYTGASTKIEDLEEGWV